MARKCRLCGRRHGEVCPYRFRPGQKVWSVWINEDNEPCLLSSNVVEQGKHGWLRLRNLRTGAEFTQRSRNIHPTCRDALWHYVRFVIQWLPPFRPGQARDYHEEPNEVLEGLIVACRDLGGALVAEGVFRYRCPCGRLYTQREGEQMRPSAEAMDWLESVRKEHENVVFDAALLEHFVFCPDCALAQIAQKARAIRE